MTEDSLYMKSLKSAEFLMARETILTKGMRKRCFLAKLIPLLSLASYLFHSAETDENVFKSVTL